MEIKDIVASFNTTPFLFIGSGFTRRYLGLPDWENLLRHFASIISDDEFAFDAYRVSAAKEDNPVGLFPKIATLIQNEYNQKWFSDPSIRTLSEEYLARIKEGGDPFKQELAAYLRGFATVQEDYIDEIELFRSITKSSISGIITTNYDCFLEDTCQGYKKYVGQQELIFSSIQGIAEIYKIHGSVEDADSIIINEADYRRFLDNSAYLAAKLMTIFMEYPIVFIGYSISDPNILEIMKSIVHCLNEKQIKQLETRFIFIEYVDGFSGSEVTPHTVIIEDKPLAMRKIRLGDFTLLYNALESKRSKLPVRLLRRFKEELYSYTITHAPTAKLRVAELEDTRVSDDDLVLAIGRASELGLKGLSGIDGNEWFRNVVLNDIEFSADELLQYAFPKVLRTNAGRLPVNKYLVLAKNHYPEAEAVAENYTFEKIIPNTFKRNRNILGEYSSVLQIWNQEKDNLEKATRLIAHLTESQINIDELESVLLTLFEEDVNILTNEGQAVRTNVRRLIMIYDCLKWGKEKEHSEPNLCKQTPSQDTPGSG